MPFPTDLVLPADALITEKLSTMHGGIGHAAGTNAILAWLLELGRKAGTGADVPAPNDVYVGNGAGSSAWIPGLTNQYVATGAGILVNKLAHLGAGNILRSDGAQNVAGPLQAGDVGAGQLPVLLGTSGVLASPVATVDFSGISQAYDHLSLLIHGRTTVAAVSEGIGVRFNLDASASYGGQQIAGAGGSVTGSELTPGMTYALIGYLCGATAQAAFGAAITSSIPGYSASGVTKTILSHSFATFQFSAGQLQMRMHTNGWANAAPITAVRVLPVGGGSFAIGSIISLYGWP